MKPIYWQTQLYFFLLYCSKSDLPKEVVDLGAGGEFPPLALFAKHGFKTRGIDIDEEQIAKANQFGREQGYDLNIEKGDLRNLPYPDGSVNFAYSYNTIFHMSKAEIAEAIAEIKRVLAPGGLCFINFASTDDFRAAVGEKVREGEYLQEEFGAMVLHSYHAPDEPENYFAEAGLKVLYKERRIREGYARSGEKIMRGFIDYIVKKED